MLRNVFQSIESMDAETIAQGLAEKRRGVRVKSYAQSQVVLDGHPPYRSVVTELSLDGMRLKSMDAPLAEGQLIDVVYTAAEDPERLGPVRIQVAWVKRVGRELVAGARFADTRENMKRSWVRFLLQEIGFDESRTFQRRQHIRVDASIPSRLFLESGAPGEAPVDGRIVNIGIGGALLETRVSVDSGRHGSLEMSLWRILPTLRLPVTILDQRHDGELILLSLKFGALDAPQVKLLGNYIINMINQSSQE